MSATVSSPVCPMPVNTGLGQVATARATSSVSKAARSARAPPPRTMATTSQSLRPSIATARATDAGAPGPCTGTLTCETRNPKPELGQLAEEVAAALGPGAGHQPDVQWHVGHGQAGVARVTSPSASSARRSRGPLRRPAAPGGR